MSDVYWWYTSENLSPRVTPEFLARARRLLLPGAYRQEHENAWSEGADSITTAADVDAAMSLETVATRGIPGVANMYFIDLGAVTNPTVIGLGHLSPMNAIVIDRLETLQGTREAPVQIATVLARTVALCEIFPPLLIRVETWQGMGAAQMLQAAKLPVELYTPSAKSNAEEWPMLIARLTQRTLVLPKHPRLREELLNLTYELTASGIRVVDRGKIHQDHAVVVRGIVAMLEPWVHEADLSRYDPSAHERSQMDGYARWAGASSEDLVDSAGFVQDMRWFRTNPDGSRSYLW
jgi:hypothetical protein